MDGIKRKGDKIGMVSMCGMSSNVKVVATRRVRSPRVSTPPPISSHWRGVSR